MRLNLQIFNRTLFMAYGKDLDVEELDEDCDEVEIEEVQIAGGDSSHVIEPEDDEETERAEDDTPLVIGFGYAVPQTDGLDRVRKVC